MGTSDPSAALRRKLLCLAVLTATGCASSSAGSNPRARAGGEAGNGSLRLRALPRVVLDRLGDDKASSPASLALGHVAVIDLWASWCDACRDATARVERLARAFAGNRDLVVVGVNVGEPRELVERHLAGRAPFPTFLDPSFEFSDALGARRVPTVLVSDKGGAIVYEGRTLDREALRLVKTLLEG